MTEIFLKLFNISIAASWIVLAVIVLRLILKKAPKWFNCLLWGIVALRLVMPFAVESAFSLIPSAEVIPQDIVTAEIPAINSGIPAINSAVNPLFTTHLTQGEGAVEKLLSLASALWLAGMVVLLLCSAVIYLKLRWQVRITIPYQENIYVCDDVTSPFILGIFRPRIYIPSGMTEEHLQYVLAHENAHIKRRDHWWKPLSFLLLVVYWFNPLLWLAYSLLCRDIEQACDEKVIAGMDNAGKRGYSEALVVCSVHRRMIMVCPVAFGEIGVKARIKGIIHYKKPGFWILLASVVACIITAVCFLTNPKPCLHIYHSQMTVNPTCTQEGVETHTCKLCKYSYKTPAEVLAHTYDKGVVTEEPTCTLQGTQVFTCTGCGVTKTEAIEKTPHTMGEPVVTKAPNCTEKGEKTATCTGCGVTKTETIEKTPHTLGEPVLTKAPNCTEKGEKSATCTVCKKVFVVEILETNDVHDMKETVLRAATCAAPGEGVWRCTRCEHSESCTYEQLAHTYQDGITIEATCGREGQKQHICTGCGAEQWTAIPVTTKHVWIDMGIYWPDQCAFCGITRASDRSQVSNTGVSLLDGLYQPPPTMTPESLFPVIRIWP